MGQRPARRQRHADERKAKPRKEEDEALAKAVAQVHPHASFPTSLIAAVETEKKERFDKVDDESGHDDTEKVVWTLNVILVVLMRVVVRGTLVVESETPFDGETDKCKGCKIEARLKY